jgi:uncharacterized Zn finger protein
MEVVTQHGGGLFPKPAEIEMKCSCPDWAGMCKHVAAVMYGIGARLDEKPDLLFLLRKVDHLELIEGALDAAPVSEAGKPKGKKTIAAAELADVFGIEMTEAETHTEAPPAKASKPAKVRASDSKAASKKTPKRAVAAAKTTATTKSEKPAKSKPVKKVAKDTNQTSAKPASRKRLKPQPV